MSRTKQLWRSVGVALCTMAMTAGATETENMNIQIPSAAGKVIIDGKADDWDLVSGTFACGDVENQRDQYGVWIYTMWDADNLYVLARWNDLTPMNNPGSIKGDSGFNGDCLQLRVLTAPADKLLAAATRSSPQNDPGPDHPGTRTSHITAWRDRDGLDSVDIESGQKFKEGNCEGKEKGAQQAFRMGDDKRGYTQEISIPWALLGRDGWQPQAGGRIVLTFEPNFRTGVGRLTIKDIFRPDVGIDRIFTFQAPNCWGFGTLEGKGKSTPRPVRLSDGREFSVRLTDGLPVVDWTGLVISREPEGFKTIKFSVEEDGYVSLNIFRPNGTVARQLLTAAFYPKGNHEVRWDGLGTMSIRVPSQPLEAGDYTWAGIWHPGVKLTLRGWADSSSAAPWGNTWGADHGDPCAVAADAENVYLGWGGGEGTKPLQACKPSGEILWKQIRAGIASASLIAVGDGTVYVWNEVGQYSPRSLYRVDAKTGGYTTWEANGVTDLSLAEVLAGETSIPDSPSSLCAGNGLVFLGFTNFGKVAVVDARTGKTLRKLDIPRVGDIEMGPDGLLYAVAFSEKGCSIVSVDPQGGKFKTVGQVPLQGKDWVRALAVDKEGEIYCGITGDHHYVQVLDRNGKATRIIGRKEGRRLVGAWQQDGVFQISALAVDGQGQLWVTEQDDSPRRVSVWNAKSGAFVNEFFGGTTYGATGGGIDPLDPWRMVGQGCEWRLDPKTGHAKCVSVITRDGMMSACYGLGPKDRQYLAVSAAGANRAGHPVRFYERLSDGTWKLRSILGLVDKDKKREVMAWADENDDEKQQPDEIKTFDDDLGGWMQGWYLQVNSDLTCYGSMKQIKVTGWTKCGAPVYDISKATVLPAPADGKSRGGMGAQHTAGSPDNRFVLWNGMYGTEHSSFDCFDIASGKQVWSYPNNYTGVHGSHHACSPEVGMIRGAFDVCGSITLPQPIGTIWVIPTNKGEWHALTEKGYYLTRFFEGDVMKMALPDSALPGADCTRCPPGGPEESFGGSICLDKNGGFSLQTGHTSFWNIEVHGLEQAKALAGGKLSLGAEDVENAKTFRQRYLKVQDGDRTFAVGKATPAFTGDLTKDFGAKTVKAFARQDNAKVKTALAWDEKNLYAAWEVMDDTPWVNGADAPEFMYTWGDTVDLQLGLNPKAGNREKAEVGDLRLSIGPFQGQPMAVIYRRIVAPGAEKKPMKFSSGVFRDGVPMDSVTFPKDVKVSVKLASDKKSYVLEAAIPWTTLGAKPEAGMKLTGDLGVTHGNKAGNNTVLRSYWSNPNTGLVSDDVEELMMTPRAWGGLEFAQ